MSTNNSKGKNAHKEANGLPLSDSCPDVRVSDTSWRDGQGAVKYFRSSHNRSKVEEIAKVIETKHATQSLNEDYFAGMLFGYAMHALSYPLQAGTSKDSDEYSEKDDDSHEKLKANQKSTEKQKNDDTEKMPPKYKDEFEIHEKLEYLRKGLSPEWQVHWSDESGIFYINTTSFVTQHERPM